MISLFKRLKVGDSVIQGLALHNCQEAATQQEIQEIRETIFDIIRTIRDPEKVGQTLQDLQVVREELITPTYEPKDGSWVTLIQFVPTVPHCSLATLIGLCIRIKLNRELPPNYCKIDIVIRKGSHDTEAEISKQINDKERVAAAMENPHLSQTVQDCIKEQEDY